MGIDDRVSFGVNDYDLCESAWAAETLLEEPVSSVGFRVSQHFAFGRKALAPKRSRNRDGDDEDECPCRNSYPWVADAPSGKGKRRHG